MPIQQQAFGVPALSPSELLGRKDKDESFFNTVLGVAMQLALQKFGLPGAEEVAEDSVVQQVFGQSPIFDAYGLQAQQRNVAARSAR